MSKNFHCCATCQHYRILKTPSGTATRCDRLGYETKPAYQFNCWNPKDQVRQLIDKREQS
ncbi:hypothetical protein [Tumebacillus flagellatus]|uniref:Uncharacterized protein n=1 Tax=Tumebacillus flagellatus TaxID=1157490 RepID=A0A074LR28_9BACL|nr:hypothetical protein [Tumebacillus flagellatus]KEO82278.1 hypothetical protein EL26_15965 [Tumebacillus flagellatus]